MSQHSLNRYIRFFSLSIPVSCSLLLSSCKTDFTSVETFVNTYQAEITTDSNILADDIYNSCLRRANYVQLSDTKGITMRNSIIQECQSDNQPNVKKVELANNVILNYMTKLGQVASGKTVTVDNNIDALQQAIQNLKVGSFKFKASDVQAGTDILKTIVNVFSKSERGKALKKAILCSDDSLQKYITGNPFSEKDQLPSGGLIQIAQSYNSEILGIEKTQIDGYYQTYFSELGQNNSQISTELEVQNDYIKAQEIVNNKSNNAKSYIDLLQSTAQAHHMLKKEFEGTGKDAISPSEENELCKSVLAGKESKLEKSNVSNKLNINQQQLSKAKVILAKYLNTVNSLRKDSK